MKAEAFLTTVPETDDIWGPWKVTGLNEELVEAVRLGKPEAPADLVAALALCQLARVEFLAMGTSGGTRIENEQSGRLLRALGRVLDRLGVPFDPPFRDFDGFHAHWSANGGYGSWDVRRQMVAHLFDPVRDALETLEEDAYRRSLANPISPRGRTGWRQVDEEITELRRLFSTAHNGAAYSAVGNNCVRVLEALSAVAYDPARHLPEGEQEPPVAETKKRLDRVVEVELTGSGSRELRKLVRAAIEAAQATKHRTPSRRDAGIAADSTILLANILRRLRPEDEANS